jgi:pyridoxamine 5'-phosphate oxidase
MELKEGDLKEDPIEQFHTWFDEAKTSISDRPEAMTLATAGKDGKPSARIVLLKDFDARGFVFYTNYNSDKGEDLAGNPFAALVFWWPPLDRQVRVQGAVEKISRAESETYFATRPRGSQIGAWASDQSSVIAGRGDLEQRAREMEHTYDRVEIPCPPFWGGYRVAPTHVEFWQGRSDRLHDRFCYHQTGDNWSIERLSP